MTKKSISGKRVLITGGTSGLGKSLAYKFLKRGCEVIVLGRSIDKISAAGLNVMYCDLDQLSSVVEIVDELKRQQYKFDFLINNAGILSPPSYSETTDGFEMSYQVNFLSHVLLTRLLIKSEILKNPFVINMSSPIYTKGSIELPYSNGSYGVLKAYANSKLFLAMFSEKLTSEGVRSFSFNPGTFRSGIYRSQKKWFQLLYKTAAPFMVSPDIVAERILQIIEKDEFVQGKLIRKNGRGKFLSHIDENAKSEFWEKINQQLYRYF